MKNISTPNDMDQLLDLLVNARSDKERKELESTIVAVSMRIPENKPRVDNILAKMKVVGDSQTRSSFYKIFAKISDPEALPELRSGLVSKDDLLKTSAIKALSAWQDDEPANDLFLIAQSSLNEQHRVLALRGYFNLAILDANASQDEIAERYIQALPLAKTLDDKRMALSGLARIKSIFALKSVASYLNNNDLKNEAEIAVIKISGKLDDKFAGEILPFVKMINKQTKEQSIRDQSGRIILQMEKLEK